MTESAAVFFSYIIAFATGLIAVLLLQVDMFGAAIILLVYLCIILIVAVFEYQTRRKN